MYFNILIGLTGIFSIFTDLALKKIKNIHLGLIIFCALIIYFVSFINGQLNISGVLVFNPLIGLAVGFLLYLSGIFKGGDAKLFFTYSLLLPHNRYPNILPFTCLALFANTFIVSFLFILPFLLQDIIVKKPAIIKEVFSQKTLLDFGRIFLITFGLSWLIEPSLKFLFLKSNVFLNFILLYLGYLSFYKVLNKIKIKWIIIFMFILGCALRYVLIPDSYSYERMMIFFKKTFLFSVIFYTLRMILDSQEGKSDRIPFAPFMFLGAILTNTDFLPKIIRFLTYLK